MDLGRLALPLLVPLALAGCTPGARRAAVAVAPVAMQPITYRVVSTPTAVGANPMVDSRWPATLDLWLRLVPADALGGTFELSRAGVVYTGTYLLSGFDAHLVLVSYAPFVVSTPSGCGHTDVAYTDLLVHGLDDDGDGIADRLEGEASGSGYWIWGLVEGSTDFAGPVVGTRDASGPTLALNRTTPVHPLAELVAVVGEPIATASLDLVDATTGSVVAGGAFASVGAAATAVAFRRPVVPLPYGRSFRVQTPAGLGTDADGNGTGPASFAVVPEPALFTSYGLEGIVPVLLDGAQLVTARSRWPAFEGAQAIELGYDAAITARMQTTTETQLLLRLRYGTKATSFAATLSIRFFDESGVSTVEVPTPTGLAWNTDANLFQSTGIVALPIPLPALAQGHAFSVEIRMPAQPATRCGVVPPTMDAVLVEELRPQ